MRRGKEGRGEGKGEKRRRERRIRGGKERMGIMVRKVDKIRMNVVR